MALDHWLYNQPGLTAPANSVEAVTPSDTVDLPNGICRALLVGSAGVANIIDGSGIERTGIPLLQGFNPIRVQRVLTGGTASNIWALY
jgi:hypothetical protein